MFSSFRFRPLRFFKQKLKLAMANMYTMITARRYRPRLDESSLNIIRSTARNRCVSNTTKKPAASRSPTDEESRLRQRLAVLERERLQHEKHKRQQANPAKVPLPRYHRLHAKEAHKKDLPRHNKKPDSGAYILYPGDLTEADEKFLEDLLLKEWRFYHPKRTVPDASWKHNWYDALFKDKWTSRVEPIKPTLHRDKSAEIGMPIENIKEFLCRLEAFDSREQRNTSLYNRGMIRYLARSRIRFWLRNRCHQNVPAEPNFKPVEPRLCLVRLHEMAGQIEGFAIEQLLIENDLAVDFSTEVKSRRRNDR